MNKLRKKVLRKSIVFTLSVIVLVSLLSVVFFSSKLEISKNSKKAEYTKIKITNDVVRYISEGYLDSIVRSSSYRGLRCMLEYMKEHPGYFNNASLAFKEVMTEQTIDSNNLPSRCNDVFKNMTIDYLLNKTNYTIKKYMGVYMNYSIRDLSLFQNNKTNEWVVGVNYNISLYFELGQSNNILAKWKVNVSRNVSLSIVNFTDPLSIKGRLNSYDSNNLPVNYRVNITPYVPKAWNHTTVYTMLANQAYAYNQYAPSFIDRLQGKPRPSKCCGIERLLNATLLNFQLVKSYFNDYGASYKNISYVDYCFFWGICNNSNSTNRTIFNITYFSNFRLEPDHLANYFTSDEINSNFITKALDEYCGDGICQNYAEDHSNCPDDCP